MLKNFWKQMRWSLRTQVLIVLVIGFAFVLWQRREPWYFSGESWSARRHKNSGYESPDGTRYVDSIQGNLFGIFDKSHFGEIPQVSICLWSHYYHDEYNDPSLRKANFRFEFEDNDTLINATDFRFKETGDRESIEFLYAVYKRRHPEWWWGHLYRPEVWLLPLMLGLLIWSIRKDRAVTA